MSETPEKAPDGHVECLPLVDCTTCAGHLIAGKTVHLPPNTARSLTLLGLLRIVGDGLADVVEVLETVETAITAAPTVLTVVSDATEAPAAALQAAYPTAKRKRGG